MTGKKSFILYCDLIATFESLSDEEAGRLIKHILRYVNDQEPVAPDRITEITFMPIKQQFKRDLEKWKDVVDKRAESGRLGGIKSAEARKKAKEGQANASKNEASASKSKQNQAVNGTVSVSDNGTVKDINTKREARAKDFYNKIAAFKEKYPKEMLRKFYDYWTEPNKSGTKMRYELEKTWDVARRLKTWADRDKNRPTSQTGQQMNIISTPKDENNG